MYKCLDCEHIFNRPARFIETHGLDGPPYEEFYGCPICGGSYDDYDESEEEETEDER